MVDQLDKTLTRTTLELKLEGDSRKGILMPALTRTTLELKRKTHGLTGPRSLALTRTTLELKPLYWLPVRELFRCTLTRTTLELKRQGFRALSSPLNSHPHHIGIETPFIAHRFNSVFFSHPHHIGIETVFFSRQRCFFASSHPHHIGIETREGLVRSQNIALSPAPHWN